jgi:hypothetical protein
MASRREPPSSLEFFPTPPWATRALCEHVLGRTDHMTCWEPAAGEGHMAEPLRSYFRHVHASDVFDYGRGYARGLFAAPNGGALIDDFARWQGPDESPAWIITNPPFSLATGFLDRALGEASTGVALFVRLQWLESADRYGAVFRRSPPNTVALFVDRVALAKGRWDPDGSTATAYCWCVWDAVRRNAATTLQWIPPGSKAALTRPEDRVRFAHPLETTL